MLKLSLLAAMLVVLESHLSQGCLITNCPRGGKRSGKFSLQESGIRPCVTCGPGRTGQCFGPAICCGPFGCLLGAPETTRCQHEGYFHESVPCIAGSAPCRDGKGRCAADGICCSQDSCVSDRSCSSDYRPHRIFQDNAIPADNYKNYNSDYATAEN